MQFRAQKLMSTVLQRKSVSSDESDKKHYDKNLYLKVWRITNLITLVFPMNEHGTFFIYFRSSEFSFSNVLLF